MLTYLRSHERFQKSFSLTWTRSFGSLLWQTSQIQFQFHYMFLSAQMLSAGGGTAIPRILLLKELLCQDEGQPVSDNTSTITTSVLLIELLCTTVFSLIMCLFIKIFIVILCLQSNTRRLISMSSPLHYYIHFMQCLFHVPFEEQIVQLLSKGSDDGESQCYKGN